MKSAFIVFFVVVCGFANGKPLQNNQQRFFAMVDEKGRVRVEDLLRSPRNAKAELTDITFYLFTTKNPSDPEQIVADNFQALVSSPNFDSSRKNVLVLHGWGGSSTNQYIQDIKTALLSKFDLNVFAVDYTPIADLGYVDVVNEVPSVALIISDFAQNMIATFGITPADFYLVGHSLGGQIIGKIGANLGGLVDTIVGLDVAFPLFPFNDTEKRLDPSDGQFVHVIHTNAGLKGYDLPIGHADYYPNGGDLQAGCGTDGFGTCSHARSHQYYIESIYTSGFRSVQCGNYDEFLAGACTGNPESLMGEYAVDKSATGTYYLQTAEASPFALG